jgi:hypothetical protein
VGGGPVLEVFEGEASRESGNVTWESFVHGVEIDICIGFFFTGEEFASVGR